MLGKIEGRRSNRGWDSFHVGSDGKVSSCNVGDPVSFPGLERSPGEGHGNPPQYSCLRNPMDRGAWWVTVHGAAKESDMTQHGEGNGTPLQYSCLENPMDGGTWWAAVHGVAMSRTWLSDFTFTFMHWRRKWQPTPVFLPGESQGWGSLVGCRLWGRTESDTTEAT